MNKVHYIFRPMDAASARAIAGWHYEGIYAFYDMEQDPADLAELLDPSSWDNHYFAVSDESGTLVGFFAFEADAGTVTIGLGLRPDLTGKGLGQPFVEAGLNFARQTYAPASFELDVATFNQRAIRLYRSLGFEDAGTFLNATNGGLCEFLHMVRSAER